MSAITSRCSHCSSQLEADCTFCPDCGAPNPKHTSIESAQAPYAWMNGQRSAVQFLREETGTSQPLTTYYPPPSRIQQAQYEPPAPSTVKSTGLASFGMTMGIVTACLMIIGLVPCLGWMNWLVIMMGIVSKILNWVVIFTDKTPAGRNKGVIGLLLTGLALFIGGIRLALGGGCI